MEFDDLPREKLKELIFEETENFHRRQVQLNSLFKSTEGFIAFACWEQVIFAECTKLMLSTRLQFLISMKLIFRFMP